MKINKIGFAQQLCLFAAQLLQTAALAAILLVVGGKLLALWQQIGKAIQHIQLIIAVAELQGLVLGVQTDEAVGDALEGGKIGGRIIDKSTGVARSRNFAANGGEQGKVQILLFKNRFQLIVADVKSSFYHTFATAVEQYRSISAFA